MLRDRAGAVRHARQPRDGSREAVDALVERAGAAGGRIGDTDDYPFMYQRQFDDPDGYHYSPFWMKPEADQAA